jgi:TolB-like protein/DNA-binding winged helix-turn-helix (wHTH) protein/cytochrome c-type biogenesis protein CcmH/NrfG
MSATPINLAETPDFDLGGLRVSPAHRLAHFNGEQRELEPKVAQVLVALASARPHVVSRDRLIEQCWDGRIVGDDALNRCIVALRHLAKEYSPEPFAIETVPRVGYCLVERPGTRPEPTLPARKAFSSKAALVALLVLLAGASILALNWSRIARSAEPASIAVLPFRNLSSGDPYFAQGVGEEIMGQLAREPAFRVAGSASSAQFAGPSDPRKVGQALDVDYVLEGSVRPGGDRVRINAALIRTKDGIRLWSDTYDRKLEDILAIQSAIGEAVASGLKRRLVHSTAPGAQAVNGEAYALYLNARGLVRSGNPQSGPDALKLLREAIRLDPSYAPAWVSLAEALQLVGRTQGPEGLIAIIPEARASARQALKLDPNLPQAHGVFASLIEQDSLEGIAHRRRAGELDPRSAEGLLAGGQAREASGEWAEALVAYRRAHDLDPLWSLPLRTMLDFNANLGDRAASESIINKEFRDDTAIQSFALARAAWFSGDFSEAARRWAELAKGQSQWSSPSKLSLDNALFMLQLSKNPPSRPPRPSIGQARLTPAAVLMKEPPNAAEWVRRNRSSAAELVYRDENVVGAKLMLSAGRARELAATYDGPTGLLGLRHGEPVGTCYLQNAAIVALALRAVHRGADADALLRQADAVIRKAYRRGDVPLWFDEDAAGIWTIQGKKDQAVAALERALRRGSSHSTRTDLPRLADEPALASLRGYGRFEAVRRKYDALYARERQETARVLKIPI